MRRPILTLPFHLVLSTSLLASLQLACGGGGSSTGGTPAPPPPNPPVVSSAVPPVATAGTVVILTGSNLTGSTSVKFGGVAATTFAVVDATHIRAVVPAGAASGSVVVGGPNGDSAGLALTIPSRTYTGSFTATGSLAQGRSEHQAVMLPNGKVLVAGGSYSTGPNAATWTSSCELFNPATGTWSSTGSLNFTGRMDFNALLLPNGKVLATGNGFSYTGTETAELYDPATGVWTKSGNNLTKRWVFPTVLLSDGRVLAVGGQTAGGPTATCELFDPATGTWSATGSMATPRWYAIAVLLRDGRVLAAAGYNTTDLTSSEIYDPATGIWSAGPALGASRLTEGFLAPDGKVLLFKASGLVVVDPVAGTATQVADGVSGSLDRSWANRALLADGRFLLAGGRTPTLDVGDSATYDPAARTFATTGSQTIGRTSGRTVLLADGSVLVAGGYAYGAATIPQPGTCDLYR